MLLQVKNVEIIDDRDFGDENRSNSINFKNYSLRKFLNLFFEISYRKGKLRIWEYLIYFSKMIGF